MGTIQWRINMASQVLGPIIQTKDALYPQTASERKLCKLWTVASDSDQESKKDIKLLISKKQSMSTCIYLIRTSMQFNYL